tara:strand:+ start:3070 stop:3924 length:855 start_codon:yes stop_codon:yes gene_type:complete
VESNKIIKFENFSFKYNNSKNLILKNINLDINKDEITTLAGPTGCGKSTLLRTINGLIPHMYNGEYNGRILVDGINVKDVEMKEIAKKVGFVFQNPENQIFMFTVERDIAFGLENLGVEQKEIREKINKIMELLKITELSDKGPHELSDGQKQKTALAGILAMEPKILILDEPTSLLDPKTASEFIKLINKLRKKNGMSVIIVEHRLDLVLKYTNKLIILSNGKIIANDTPKNIFNYKNQLISELNVPFATKLYRELSKNNILFSEPVTDADEIINKFKGNQYD